MNSTSSTSTAKNENSNNISVKKWSPWYDLFLDISLVLFCTSFLFGYLIYPYIIYYVIFKTHYSYLAFFYLLWMYYDKETPECGGRKIKIFENSFTGRYLRDYFPVGLIKTDDLPPTKNYIFATFPHGMICFGGGVNFMSDKRLFQKLYPGLDVYNTTLSSNFSVPIARDLMLMRGMISVSEKSILNILNKKPNSGTVCNIVVGGAAEAFHCIRKEYKIILKRRRGFVRLALKTGSSIVPVFCFGENQVCESVKVDWLENIQQKLYKATGYAPVLIKGRKFGPIPSIWPKRSPINTVVGKPIDVPKIENPSEEEISKYHEIFKEELYRLFETHKEQYDPLGKSAILTYI